MKLNSRLGLVLFLYYHPSQSLPALSTPAAVVDDIKEVGSVISDESRIDSGALRQSEVRLQGDISPPRSPEPLSSLSLEAPLPLPSMTEFQANPLMIPSSLPNSPPKGLPRVNSMPAMSLEGRPMKAGGAAAVDGQKAFGDLGAPELEKSVIGEHQRGPQAASLKIQEKAIEHTHSHSEDGHDHSHAHTHGEDGHIHYHEPKPLVFVASKHVHGHEGQGQPLSKPNEKKDTEQGHSHSQDDLHHIHSKDGHVQYHEPSPVLLAAVKENHKHEAHGEVPSLDKEKGIQHDHNHGEGDLNHKHDHVHGKDDDHHHHHHHHQGHSQNAHTHDHEHADEHVHEKKGWIARLWGAHDHHNHGDHLHSHGTGHGHSHSHDPKFVMLEHKFGEYIKHFFVKVLPKFWNSIKKFFSNLGGKQTKEQPKTDIPSTPETTR